MEEGFYDASSHISNKQQQEATYNNIEQQNQRTQMGEGFGRFFCRKTEEKEVLSSSYKWL